MSEKVSARDRIRQLETQVLQFSIRLCERDQQIARLSQQLAAQKRDMFVAQLRAKLKASQQAVLDPERMVFIEPEKKDVSS